MILSQIPEYNQSSSNPIEPLLLKLGWQLNKGNWRLGFDKDEMKKQLHEFYLKHSKNCTQANISCLFCGKSKWIVSFDITGNGKIHLNSDGEWDKFIDHWRKYCCDNLIKSQESKHVAALAAAGPAPLLPRANHAANIIPSTTVMSNSAHHSSSSSAAAAFLPSSSSSFSHMPLVAYHLPSHDSVAGASSLHSSSDLLLNNHAPHPIASSVSAFAFSSFSSSSAAASSLSSSSSSTPYSSSHALAISHQQYHNHIVTDSASSSSNASILNNRANIEFYSNQLPAIPRNETIDKIHKEWFQLYQVLEDNDLYIQSVNTDVNINFLY
jgi:hypothetical protein